MILKVSNYNLKVVSLYWDCIQSPPLSYVRINNSLLQLIIITMLDEMNLNYIHFLE